jgi:hypothetical protein
MRRRLAILLGLAIFWGAVAFLIDDAHAQSYLSIATARRAIGTYEGLYWKGQPVTVTIGSCQRHSAVQVSCITQATAGATTIRTRDWATRIAHDDIRVHPGTFEVLAP